MTIGVTCQPCTGDAERLLGCWPWCRCHPHTAADGGSWGKGTQDLVWSARCNHSVNKICTLGVWKMLLSDICHSLTAANILFTCTTEIAFFGSFTVNNPGPKFNLTMCTLHKEKKKSWFRLFTNLFEIIQKQDVYWMQNPQSMDYNYSDDTTYRKIGIISTHTK